MIAEELKGEWISIQDYIKDKNEYPRDLIELNKFYNYTPTEDEKVVYIKPTDENKNEVILWWKEKSRLNHRIGIKESGEVIKEKD